MVAHPRRVRGGAQVLRGRELMRAHHARGDRFAVEQAVRIARLGLERMAETVAEIEQRADVLRPAPGGGHHAGPWRNAVRDRLVAGPTTVPRPRSPRSPTPRPPTT